VFPDSDFLQSLIKQITALASDEELSRFVPREIIPDLRAKLQDGSLF